LARQRQQLIGILSSEKNRVHKILSDGGIRLSVVVSDIHGVAGRAMVKALIAEPVSRRGADAGRQPPQGRPRNCSMRLMASSRPTTVSCCMS
jgi:hypothetical protein